jgi:NitT/TauT family transport system ATP-binding protein
LRININGLAFGFTQDLIFNNFSLNLGGDDETGNPVALLGPSGSGKTTLLRIIAGFLKPEAGSVSGIGAVNISFVFQESRLLPRISALKNVTLPVERLLGAAEAEKRSRRFLSLCGMESFADALPLELSGGQRRRISIARAWAYPAPIVLMDEPFQSLDIPLRIQMMDSIRILMREERRLVIVVTHSPREALYLAKRIIVLGRGFRDSAFVAFDELHDAPFEEREFISERTVEFEKRIIAALSR